MAKTIEYATRKDMFMDNPIKDIEDKTIEDLKKCGIDTKKSGLSEQEHQIFKLEQIIASVNGVNIKDNFSIEFGQLEYPKTTQEQIAKEEYELDKGFVTEAELLQKRRKDITVKQAEKIIEKNSVDKEPEVEQTEEESDNG